MVGWHHQFNGHESEETPGDGDGQGGLACCGPWGRKESDTTERLNGTELTQIYMLPAVQSHQVMSDCLGPRGLQPARLLCPWDFPGKFTGVGCHLSSSKNAAN